MQLLPKIIRKLGLARLFNLVTSATVGGRTFRIPLQGAFGYENMSISEPWMATLLSKAMPIFAKPGCLFVDVGTNVGQTLLKMRSVIPDFPYVGFEPNPFCVYYMNELVKANQFRNVTVYPFGISNRSAVLELQFYCDGDLDSSASLVDNFRADQKVVRRLHVPVFPPTVVKFEGRVSFLKIDVEGGELEVLEGMQTVLSKDRPIVLTEILPVYSESNIDRLSRQSQIERMFREFKYDCFRVRTTANDAFERLEPIEFIGIHSQIPLSDYLWVPSENRNDLLEIFKSTFKQ